MNVTLLYSDHWHVSVTQVAIFSVLSVPSEKSTVQITPSLSNLLHKLPYILPMDIHHSTEPYHRQPFLFLTIYNHYSFSI